jgi:hypothetical protein
MMDIEFDPHRSEGIDPETLEIRTQARQVALYLQALKDAGTPDAEALEITRDWLRECFESARADDQ